MHHHNQDMTLRTTRDTIDDLHGLLKDLEEPKGSDYDPAALDSLRQIVLSRIDALEAAEEQESSLIARLAHRSNAPKRMAGQ